MPTESNRNWFQFSLRLLILVVLAANVLWWAVGKYQDALTETHRNKTSAQLAAHEARISRASLDLVHKELFEATGDNLELSSENATLKARLAALKNENAKLKSQAPDAAVGGGKLLQNHALQVGLKVLAIKAALGKPADPINMQPVVDLGQDSRYYVMVRGWLAQKLRGDESILAARGANAPQAIQQRVAFLKRAIRRLDLE
jgi:hypothetical protein